MTLRRPGRASNLALRESSQRTYRNSIATDVAWQFAADRDCVAAVCAISARGVALAQQDLPQLGAAGHAGGRRARVAPSVVRIETVGGLERVGKVLVGTGPTTGLIVSADGFIISSAFNFVSKPSSILVRLADGTRTPARTGRHRSQRMLVLLKVNVDEQLPVPEAVPESEMHVGQWAIAVGRTFDAPRAEHVGRHRQRLESHLGQGDPDRRQDLAQQLRRAAGRYSRPRAGRAGAAVARQHRRRGRRRVVRLGHRLRRAAGARQRRAAEARAGPGPEARHPGHQPQRPRHLHQAARDRRLPAELAGLQGRLQSRRPDRRDRRPARSSGRPSCASGSTATTPATRSTSSCCAARSGSSATSRWSTSSNPTSVRSSAFCRCAMRRPRRPASPSATSIPTAPPPRPACKPATSMLVDRRPGHGQRARRSSSARPRSKSAQAVKARRAPRRRDAVARVERRRPSPRAVPAELPPAREAAAGEPRRTNRPQVGPVRRQAAGVQERMPGLRPRVVRSARFLRPGRVAAPAGRNEGRGAARSLAGAVRRAEPDPAGAARRPIRPAGCRPRSSFIAKAIEQIREHYNIDPHRVVRCTASRRAVRWPTWWPSCTATWCAAWPRSTPRSWAGCRRTIRPIA